MNVRLSAVDMQATSEEFNSKANAPAEPTQPVSKTTNQAPLEEKAVNSTKQMLNPEQLATLLKLCSFLASNPNIPAKTGTESIAKFTNN